MSEGIFGKLSVALALALFLLFVPEAIAQETFTWRPEFAPLVPDSANRDIITGQPIRVGHLWIGPHDRSVKNTALTVVGDLDSAFFNARRSPLALIDSDLQDPHSFHSLEVSRAGISASPPRSECWVNCSVAWMGWIKVEKAGEYTFSVNSTQRARLFLHDPTSPLIDHIPRRVPGGQTTSAKINLSERFHFIALLWYVENVWWNPSLTLFWQPPGQGREAVPTNVLYYPNARLLLDQAKLGTGWPRELPLFWAVESERDPSLYQGGLWGYYYNSVYSEPYASAVGRRTAFDYWRFTRIDFQRTGQLAASATDLFTRSPYPETHGFLIKTTSAVRVREGGTITMRGRGFQCGGPGAVSTRQRLEDGVELIGGAGHGGSAVNRTGRLVSHAKNPVASPGSGTENCRNSWGLLWRGRSVIEPAGLGAGGGRIEIETAELEIAPRATINADGADYLPLLNSAQDPNPLSGEVGWAGAGGGIFLRVHGKLSYLIDTSLRPPPVSAQGGSVTITWDTQRTFAAGGGGRIFISYNQAAGTPSEVQANLSEMTNRFFMLEDRDNTLSGLHTVYQLDAFGGYTIYWSRRFSRYPLIRGFAGSVVAAPAQGFADVRATDLPRVTIEDEVHEFKITYQIPTNPETITIEGTADDRNPLTLPRSLFHRGVGTNPWAMAPTRYVNLVLDGGFVQMVGPQLFHNLTINNTTLSHPPVKEIIDTGRLYTPTYPFRGIVEEKHGSDQAGLHLTAMDSLVFQGTGRVDVTGRGFLGGWFRGCHPRNRENTGGWSAAGRSPKVDATDPAPWPTGGGSGAFSYGEPAGGAGGGYGGKGADGTGGRRNRNPKGGLPYPTAILDGWNQYFDPRHLSVLLGTGGGHGWWRSRCATRPGPRDIDHDGPQWGAGGGAVILSTPKLILNSTASPLLKADGVFGGGGRCRTAAGSGGGLLLNVGSIEKRSSGNAVFSLRGGERCERMAPGGGGAVRAPPALEIPRDLSFDLAGGGPEAGAGVERRPADFNHRMPSYQLDVTLRSVGGGRGEANFVFTAVEPNRSQRGPGPACVTGTGSSFVSLNIIPACFQDSESVTFRILPQNVRGGSTPDTRGVAEAEIIFLLRRMNNITSELNEDLLNHTFNFKVRPSKLEVGGDILPRKRVELPQSRLSGGDLFISEGAVAAARFRVGSYIVASPLEIGRVRDRLEGRIALARLFADQISSLDAARNLHDPVLFPKTARNPEGAFAIYSGTISPIVSSDIRGRGTIVVVGKDILIPTDVTCIAQPCALLIIALPDASGRGGRIVIGPGVRRLEGLALFSGANGVVPGITFCSGGTPRGKICANDITIDGLLTAQLIELPKIAKITPASIFQTSPPPLAVEAFAAFGRVEARP